MSKYKMLAALKKVYTKAVEMAGKAKVTLVREPLDRFVAHAGYFFDGTADAVKIIRRIDSL